MRIISIISVLIFLSGSSFAQTSILKSVIGNGGGKSHGEGKTVNISIGQSVIGLLNTEVRTAHIGFWHITQLASEPFLVAVNRERSAEPWISQNYPNPFHERTSFDLILPYKGIVKISIYNIEGKIVDNFVNREMSAGRYHLTWESLNLPEGLYYFELVVNGYKLSRTMISI